MEQFKTISYKSRTYMDRKVRNRYCRKAWNIMLLLPEMDNTARKFVRYSYASCKVVTLTHFDL